MNIQDWFPLGLTSLVSLQSKGLKRRIFSKASVLRCSAFFMVQLSLPYMTTGKTIALTRWTFVSIVMSLLFNMLSRFVRLYCSHSPWKSRWAFYGALGITKSIHHIHLPLHSWSVHLPWGIFGYLSGPWFIAVGGESLGTNLKFSFVHIIHPIHTFVIQDRSGIWPLTT